MTRDDIIRMAREAGFVIDEKAQQHQPNCVFHTYHMIDEPLERFAALVAAAEREACAQVCDDKAAHLEMKAQEVIEAGEHDEVSAIRSTAWQLSVCADAIRARGDTNGRG